MKNKPEVVSITKEGNDSVDLVLEEARAEKFTTVVIVGFRDNIVFIKSSDCLSRVRLLGALEEAKHFILTNMAE